MPNLREAGICSASTMAFSISVSQVMIVAPPYFRYSVVNYKLSGPAYFLIFILPTVLFTSSLLNAISRNISSFWKDPDSRDVQWSTDSFKAGFSSSCDLASS